MKYVCKIFSSKDESKTLVESTNIATRAAAISYGLSYILKKNAALKTKEYSYEIEEIVS